MSIATHIRQYNSIGSFQSNGVTYRAIVIQFQNKPSKLGWANWVRAQMREMGLIPAKEEDLRICIERLGRHSLLCKTTSLVSVGEYMVNEKRHKIYLHMHQNHDKRGIWDWSYGRVRGHLCAEYRYYLALRRVEK